MIAFSEQAPGSDAGGLLQYGNGEKVITVEELIERLKALPAGWAVTGTSRGGSLQVRDPDGPRYGYVFADDRPTMLLKSRSSAFRAAAQVGLEGRDQRLLNSRCGMP